MEIRDSKGMKGLFAKKSYQTGDVICLVEGEEISHPTRTSLQIGPNSHIDVKEPIMYINHNCNGNISLKNNTFVAKRSIASGEEITFNYFDTEEVLSNPFVCRDCGSWLKGKSFGAPESCLNPFGKSDLDLSNKKGTIVSNYS